MAKNYMAEVAKMLGVEIGQVFHIKNSDSWIYRLNFQGLETKCQENEWLECNLLPKLLNGELEIIKLPWKPKYGDKYYTYYTNGEEWLIWDNTWSSDVSDYARLKSGIVFRTSQAALNALPQKYKELTGEEYE